MPQRPSTGTPQTFPVATRPGDFTRPGAPAEDLIPPGFATAQPISARLELVGLLEGLYDAGPHVHLSVSLAGSGPSGSADPSQRCKGCLPPSPAPPGSGCPPLQPSRYDDQAMKDSHLHPEQQHLAAHHR
jgi:hypothetical protein